MDDPSGLPRSVTFEIRDENEDDSDDDLDDHLYGQNIEGGSESDKDSGHSSEFDTDLEDVYEKPKDKKVNPYGEEDAFIGRNVYMAACEKHGQVPPQRRIIAELEKKTLNLTNRSMGPDNIRPLCIALVDNLRIENLILDGCDIGDEGMLQVAELLLENLVICRLNLSNNSIGAACTKALSLALSSNNTLLHLNLSENKLDDRAAFGIGPGLAKNKGILTLNLSNNKLGDNAGKIIGTALLENKRLTELDISWNELRGKGTVGLLKALELFCQTNTTLVKINLAWNGLGYEGSVAVAKALKQCPTLKYLDISHNRINWDGALVISKNLTNNSTLEVLKIGDNPLTTTGAGDIVQAVSSEKSQVRLLDVMNVAVLGETELLAIIVQRKRKFKFIHGGIVHTPDVLGQRKEREITAMERVIEYMKRLGIRPVELLRAFDKSVSFNITKKEFIGRLKRSKVGLHQYEMEALANAVASKGIESRGISYRKLVDAVQDEILLERNRKIEERKRRERKIALHKRILDVKLPVDAISEGEEELTYYKAALESQSAVTSRPGTSMSSFSTTTLQTINEKSKLFAKSTSNFTRSYPKLPLLKHNAAQQTYTPPLKPKSKSTLSMCAPLDGATKKKDKKRKKRRGKKKSHDPHVTSWMSSLQD